MIWNKDNIIRDYSLIGVESDRAMELGLADAAWYQTPIPKDKLRELLVRKNAPAIRDSIIWFGLIFISGYLVFLYWGSWFVIFPYIVYSVLYASSSDSRWHESSHGTAFKSDWMNNLLYEISSFMVFRQSTVWKWSHARHHSDTIIRGRDPEIAVPRPPNLRKIILTFFGITPAMGELKKLIPHAFGKIDPETATYVPNSEYRKVFFTARVYLFIFLAVILISIVYSTFLPLMFIGLPTLFGSWLLPIYGLTQHAGLDENVLDHRLNSRTVYMNRIHRFLYWNMNYHVEHHMFPLVPYHALPKLHELMKDDCPKPYNGLIHAYKEIIPAILKQRKDPTYFVKREVPQPSVLPNFRKDNKIVGKKKNLKGSLIEVCPEQELSKGEIVRFDFDQKTYAIYRTDHDKYYATEGMCTHGNAHLADGVIIGEMIECAKHNGRFSLIDGSPKRNPVCIGINTFKVFVKNGSVFLELDNKDQKLQTDPIPFTVVSNNNVGTFIKELQLEITSGEKFNFAAGQYVQFIIPTHKTEFKQFEIDNPFHRTWEALGLYHFYAENDLVIKRNYSLATNPDTHNPLKFNIRIQLPPGGSNVPAGCGSSYMFNLKPGDKVTLTGPFGDFLIKPTNKEMVYIGGGAGMAPIRSHISYLFESLKTRRTISFWYGARSQSELFYKEYFESIQKENENFSFRVALSEPKSEDEWSGPVGNIHDVIYSEYLINHPEPHDVEYYLCGPPGMVQAALSMLKDLQVPIKNISFDEF